MRPVASSFARGSSALAFAALAVALAGCAQKGTVTTPAAAPVAPAAPVAAAPAAAPARAAAAPAAPAPAAPAPIWAQGRTGASPLAPHAGKLTVTPASDIPIDKLKLPPGFKAEVWATGVPGARAMALADNGKMYVGTRGIGRVYEITDDGKQRTTRVVVDKLNQPAGVEYKDGSLYVIAIDKALRFDGITKNPAAQPVDMTTAFNLPKEQHHNWKYIKFGPDGKLYVPFGAPCNICVPGSEYAQIRRYNKDGSGMEVVARGVRNTQGFDWHPVTKQMWFTDHGRDWMGDDGPEDELNRISKAGLNFGFPGCHANGIVDRDVGKPGACDGVTRPVTNMGPHAANMGIRFYTGKMFPAQYKNVAFIARKGSWNRTQKFGYDVVTVTATKDGKNAKVTPFITGFLDPATDKFWGRPAYLQQLRDGSLLVSDEQLGAIYRISYAKPKK